MLPDYPHALVTIAFEEWRQAGFPNAAKLDININNQDWAILFAVLNPDSQPRMGWRALVFMGDINVGNRTGTARPGNQELPLRISGSARRSGLTTGLRFTRPSVAGTGST